MATTKQSPVRRFTLTAVVVLAAIGAVAAFVITSRPRPKAPPTPVAVAPSPAPQPPADASPGETSSLAAAPAAEPEPAAIPAAAEPGALSAIDTKTSAEPVPQRGLRVRTLAATPPDPMGSLDPATGYKARVEFTTIGAGVEAITLADYTERVGAPDPYAVQRKRTYLDASGRPVVVASLATLGVEIDGEYADLYAVEAGESKWRQTATGEFEAIIEDAEGEPVARVEKRFSLSPAAFDIRVTQRVVNLTDRPIVTRWYQYGPVELEADRTSYGIDARRLRYGYLTDPRTDPSRQIVLGDTKLAGRQAVAAPLSQVDKQLWPTPETTREQHELVWVALTNRYFAFAVHPALDDGAFASGTPPDKRLAPVETVHRVMLGLNSAPASGAGPATVGILALQLTSPALHVAPGESADLSIGVYAGPLLGAALRAETPLRELNLPALVVYNLGGFCGPCTFAWLANPLIWFLRFAHNYLVFDWSLAIILLVLVVRTALHPVTRRSQIGIARFSKQMAALAPKQQALREKFKDDPKRMQQEMARLMKEEGVSFTGALGCLPMFLQTPVWIALYAMLYFAFELRHAPGFFGVFQAVSAGRWSFLSDLSAPDHFIEFARGFHVPLASSIMGPIHGLNVLPLLLGVVFFIQQKYMTPPPSTALTPEQETQQKIMKVMMVVLFPVMMYNAPSGLAVYFIANSTLGIIESRWIRSHIDTLDLARKQKGETTARGGQTVVGRPGAGAPTRKLGFLDRVRAEAQKRIDAQQRGGGKRAGPGGRRPGGKGPQDWRSGR